LQTKKHLPLDLLLTPSHPLVVRNLGWKFLLITPLEKARKDPDAMKAKILTKTRRVFGEYGYCGATTRMIAEEVGIDISTLYYH
jgi:hypothetical protein